VPSLRKKKKTHGIERKSIGGRGKAAHKEPTTLLIVKLALSRMKGGKAKKSHPMQRKKDQGGGKAGYDQKSMTKRPRKVATPLRGELLPPINKLRWEGEKQKSEGGS